MHIVSYDRLNYNFCKRINFYQLHFSFFYSMINTHFYMVNDRRLIIQAGKVLSRYQILGTQILGLIPHGQFVLYSVRSCCHLRSNIGIYKIIQSHMIERNNASYFSKISISMRRQKNNDILNALKIFHFKDKKFFLGSFRKTYVFTFFIFNSITFSTSFFF